jgi:hypothetical protein
MKHLNGHFEEIGPFFAMLEVIIFTHLGNTRRI